uniref:Uncharacterized protein n=1 Tax=Anguilla anguilla TaxID=7936 RepID=A0A0E9TH80_ANGAN
MAYLASRLTGVSLDSII